MVDEGSLWCPNHEDTDISPVVDWNGVYKITTWKCFSEDEHDCDCEYCGEWIECGKHLYWTIHEPSGICFEGEGKAPRVEKLIEKGRLAPQEAWVKLPGF